MREHAFLEELVHSNRRRGDAGTHVRNRGELEEPLEATVFSVRSVHHGEDDVEGNWRAPFDMEDVLLTYPRGHRLEPRARCRRIDADVARVAALWKLRRIEVVPASVLVDAAQHRLVAGKIERIDNESRGNERDFMLRRAPAEQDEDRLH